MYLANPARYDRMSYRRCGASGLDLPLISLGLWQNFGRTTALETQREIILAAFDAGVTHIDLANNYGPRRGPPRPCSAPCSRRTSRPTGTSS